MAKGLPSGIRASHRLLLTLLWALAQTGSAWAQASVDLDARTVHGEGVTFDGDVVTVRAGGRYVFTGDLRGQVVVDAPGAQVTVVLDGVAVHNAVGPSLLVAAASEVTVELAVGSVNRLSDGGASELDAALYSLAPLTFTGPGALEVEAVYEGISSTSHITVQGGQLRVVAGEDALNASEDGVSRIAVHGGYLFAWGETGDGIDSNGTLEITGGTVVAIGSFARGEGGLDADGGITITGGTVVATGLRAPFPLRTPGEQKALLLYLRPVQRVGDVLTVTGPEGEPLLVFEAGGRYDKLVFSAPEVVAAGRYGVHMGGAVAGETVDGLHGAVVDLGTRVRDVRPGHISVVSLPVE